MDLRALQLFEAVARHHSLTKAAAELGITQSAVSHRLRALSERLGETLVERPGRGIAPTTAGARLADTLNSAFDIIEEQVGTLEGHRPIVRLGEYSSFAMPWLIDRLPLFLASHPDVDLRLVMLYDPNEPSVRIADMFVTSEPARAGYWTRRLAAERLVPVAGAGGPTAFDASVRYISAEVEPGIATRAWEAFATLNGFAIAPAGTDDWLCCSHYVFALGMALAGMGTALLPDCVVARHVAEGRHRASARVVQPGAFGGRIGGGETDALACSLRFCDDDVSRQALPPPVQGLR